MSYLISIQKQVSLTEHKSKIPFIAEEIFCPSTKFQLSSQLLVAHTSAKKKILEVGTLTNTSFFNDIT